jgi:23S rRNA pseudouridine1911/1915/1917 synthase
MDFLYKSKNAVVINKPALIPSQADRSGDSDAMSLASCALREGGERSDLWLVHRLDRVVGGVAVFARTKKSAAMLSEAFSTHAVKKEYFAVVEGVCESGGVMQDLLFKDSAKGKAFIVDRKRAGVKEASLEFEPVATASCERGDRTLVRVRLHTGRFHQIRAQFSHRGMPLVGDGKYGSRDNGANTPALFSANLEFNLGGREYKISTAPNTEVYPWSLFDKEAYTV